MSIQNEYLNDLMERVIKRDPNEAEFHQAVREVLTSLAPVENAHPELITEAAKKFFDDRGMTTRPKIKKLRAEFDDLVTKKRSLNAERKKVEKEVRELQMAQYFVDRAYGDAEKTEKERRTVQR